MTIGRQLTALMLGFTVAAGVAVIVVSLFQVGMQKEARATAVDAHLRSQALFAALRSVSKKQGITQRMLRENDPDRLESMLAEAKTLTQEAQNTLKGLGGDRAAVLTAFTALSAADEKCVEQYLRGEVGSAQQTLIDEANPAFDAIVAAMVESQAQASREREAAAVEADTRTSRVNLALILGGAVVGAFLFGCGLLLVRRVNSRIRQAVEELYAAARETRSAVGELLTTADQQAQSASTQAANIVETSAAGEEINSMARRNGESSRKATDLMQRSQGRVREAGDALQAMVKSIDEIHAASQAVAKIMHAVDEIAFQTNILALNAAVEAARAGGAGAGFSVVADEVRNLAHRSAQAAKDTAALTEQSIQLTTEGKRRVAGLVDVFSSITEDTGAAASLVAEVSQGSEEQAHGTAQIAKALAEMEALTERGAAAAEESAAAARQLEGQTHSLSGVVENIAVLVGRDTIHAA